MKKKCVYSAITGTYDKVNDPLVINPEFDYKLFTNNPDIKSDIWDIILIDNRENLDNKRLARRIKILFYEYVGEYDLNVWVDANIHIINDIQIFLDQIPLADHDLLVSRHPIRTSIFDEGAAVIKHKRDTTENVNIQMAAYGKTDVPKTVLLPETGIMVRKNVLSIREFSKIWFNEILTYSHRDQLSFNYAEWLYPIDFHTFRNFRYFFKDVFSLKVHG